MGHGQWIDPKEQHTFRYVSGVLLATLGWHWFPMFRAAEMFLKMESNSSRRRYMFYKAGEFITGLDALFLLHIFLGHPTVVWLFKRLAPEVFDAPEKEVQLMGAQANDNERPRRRS